MIDYKERLDVFIASFCQDETEELFEIEEEAIKNSVPIIKRGARNTLRNILEMKRPAKILEIGTAIGFSAILMAKEVKNCQITTIENYEPRIKEARNNFSKYEYSDRIQLIEGDAVKILSGMEDKFDFVFLDMAKAQYIRLLPDIVRLLHKDGVLFADNILQDNWILESHFAVERRDRTIHSRMREYLYEITHHPQLKSSIIPVDDGVALSVKI